MATTAVTLCQAESGAWHSAGAPPSVAEAQALRSPSESFQGVLAGTAEEGEQAACARLPSLGMPLLQKAGPLVCHNGSSTNEINSSILKL